MYVARKPGEMPPEAEKVAVGATLTRVYKSDMGTMRSSGFIRDVNGQMYSTNGRMRRSIQQHF
jgi:hypothetical protein